MGSGIKTAAAFGALALVLAGCGGSSKKKTAAVTTTTAAAVGTTTTVQSGTAAGLSQISVPSGANPEDFGRSVSVAVDASGNPMVAFINHDPNGDKKFDDSTISVDSLDTTSGKFKSPVVVSKGDSDADGREVSLAFDPSTKTFGLAWSAATDEIDVAFSTDGTTWNKTVAVNDKDSGARLPALAMAAGKATLAFVQDSSNPIGVVTAATESANATWTATEVPKPASGKSIRALRPGAAATPTAAVIALIADGDPSGVEVDSWTVGASNLVKVVDSNKVQNDSPSIALSAGGANLVIGATICRADDDANCLYSSQSTDDGKTWSTASKVPDDVTDGASLQTEIAAGSKGAVLLWSPNGSNGADQCGRPEVSESNDQKTWRSCTFDKGKKFGVSSGSYGAAFASGNNYWLVFQNRSQGEDPALGAGVWLAQEQLKAAG